MIVKIQRDMTGQRCLIYNEDESVFLEVEYAEPLTRLNMAPGTKIYCEADINDAQELMIGERIDTQPW